MDKAKDTAKKEPERPVSNALAFQEETDDGVRIGTNISFVGPAKAVKAAMQRVLDSRPDS